MRKIALFVIVAFLAFSCASSKKAVDISIGTWDYILKDLPDGDRTGHFIIAKEGDTYTGSINSDLGSTPLEDITIEEDNLNCTFDYQGYEILIKGTFEGSTFTGGISVDYNEFPMTAVRKLE